MERRRRRFESDSSLFIVGQTCRYDVNGSIPSFQVGCAGSNPVICSTIFVKAFHLHRIDDRRINHFTASVAMGTVRPFQNPAHILHAGIAQLAEHRICNPGVAGSTPVISSIYAQIAQSDRATAL